MSAPSESLPHTTHDRQPAEVAELPPFLKALLAGATSCGLADCRVLCAVSGGADSVALLTALLRLREKARIEVVVAHLNHHLRGAESDADAHWVLDLCQTLQVPCVVRSLDVSQRAATHNETIEEAARHLRYAALIEIAMEQRCRFVATGHNADDLVETVLHHIVRGTGLSGLRGMPRTRVLASSSEAQPEVVLARPLLSVTRSEIEQWLSGERLSFRHDATNSDSAFTRNRIRNELLPLLERDFNPQVRKSMLTLATQAGEVSDWLTDAATQLGKRACLDALPDVLRINVEALQSEPRCLVRETLRVLWQSNQWPLQRMTYQHWNQLAELVVADAGSLNLPGNVIARRRKKLLVLERHE